MARLFFVIVSVFLCSCARHSNPLKEILPVQVQRTFTLEEARPLAGENVPEIIRAQGSKQALFAVYKGGAERIRVLVFEMGSETSAFELIQKWRQSEGLGFYKRQDFVVAKGSDIDRTTLSEFLQALQKDMK